MRLTCAARSDAGRVRAVNDDAYRMSPEHGLFIVADGTGSLESGGTASDLASRLILQHLGCLEGMSELEASRRVHAAIRHANASIFETIDSRLARRLVGTTATVLVVLPNRFLVGHVGNSRAYLLRDGRLMQLTRDHTYVQEQVDAGLLTADQARGHPWRKVITRCVGASADVIPDVILGELQRDDILLIASDGLTGMVDDDELLRILSSDGEPSNWVGRMISAANLQGGLDNITAVVIRIDSMESEALRLNRLSVFRTRRP